MSEAEKVDKAERRKHAEARLTRSRPAREAAAAAHAGRMGKRSQSVAVETASAATGRERSPELSRLERKVLDAANDILVSRGDEGQRIAALLRVFVDSRLDP